MLMISFLAFRRWCTNFFFGKAAHARGTQLFGHFCTLKNMDCESCEPRCKHIGSIVTLVSESCDLSTFLARGLYFVMGKKFGKSSHHCRCTSKQRLGRPLCVTRRPQSPDTGSKIRPKLKNPLLDAPKVNYHLMTVSECTPTYPSATKGKPGEIDPPPPFPNHQPSSLHKSAHVYLLEG